MSGNIYNSKCLYSDTDTQYLRRRERLKVPIIIVLRLEKRITQRNLINPPHIQIIQQIRVQVEENRHIDRLSGIQPLLLEAETLYLAEVRSHLRGCHAVGRDTDDVGIAPVRRGVEGESGFAGEHAYFALLRHEFPRQDVGDGGAEGYADAPCVGYGDHAGRGVEGAVAGAAVVRGADRLAAPACCLADHLIHGNRSVRESDGAEDDAECIVHRRSVLKFIVFCHPFHRRSTGCPSSLRLLLRCAIRHRSALGRWFRSG